MTSGDRRARRGNVVCDDIRSGFTDLAPIAARVETVSTCGESRALWRRDTPKTWRRGDRAAAGGTR